jgi:hypothetical protein
MNMNDAIETLLGKIRNDYLRFMTNMRDTRNEDDFAPHQKEMIENFNKQIEFKEGKKYIKILQNGAVWGFVVNVENDKQFQYGDILKAASYTTPARNAARGNIFGEYTAPWTGAEYLR